MIQQLQEIVQLKQRLPLILFEKHHETKSSGFFLAKEPEIFPLLQASPSKWGEVLCLASLKFRRFEAVRRFVMSFFLEK